MTETTIKSIQQKTTQSVIIEPNESLQSLAQRLYGNSDLWREVGDELRMTVFDPLRAGEKVSLPSKQELLNRAKNLAVSALQSELKKKYPELDLSSLKTKDLNVYQIINWIL